MVKRLMHWMSLSQNAQKSLPNTVSTGDVRMDPRGTEDGAQPAAEDTPLNGFQGHQGPVRNFIYFISVHKFLQRSCDRSIDISTAPYVLLSVSTRSKFKCFVYCFTFVACGNGVEPLEDSEGEYFWCGPSSVRSCPTNSACTRDNGYDICCPAPGVPGKDTKHVLKF